MYGWVYHSCVKLSIHRLLIHFTKAHYIMAEAARRLIVLGKCDFIPSTNPVADAISDYYKCVAINPERADALVEAMALAMDSGKILCDSARWAVLVTFGTALYHSVAMMTLLHLCYCQN